MEAQTVSGGRLTTEQVDSRMLETRTAHTGQKRRCCCSTTGSSPAASPFSINIQSVFGKRLWKSVGCHCSVKNCWFFTPPGASPWRCSRPGCLCGRLTQNVLGWHSTRQIKRGHSWRAGNVNTEARWVDPQKLQLAFSPWLHYCSVFLNTSILRSNNLFDEWIKWANWTPQVRGCYQSGLSRRNERPWCKDNMTVTVICTCSLFLE